MTIESIKQFAIFRSELVAFLGLLSTVMFLYIYELQDVWVGYTILNVILIVLSICLVVIGIAIFFTTPSEVEE